ncbi:hypothetical protein CBOM_03004 [Ceraceosorus bombacis]|uniref:Uncharacterized protein n=1 Tax=Ceraceosorus bombacis TaxID=401625 RepID=A0A0P1BKQ0_9BASI|nr:hypothetical protein CBOM_03004 [Ceraceosorus bombacis]
MRRGRDEASIKRVGGARVDLYERGIVYERKCVLLDATTRVGTLFLLRFYRIVRNRSTPKMV